MEVPSLKNVPDNDLDHLIRIYGEALRTYESYWSSCGWSCRAYADRALREAEQKIEQELRKLGIDVERVRREYCGEDCDVPLYEIVWSEWCERIVAKDPEADLDSCDPTNA